MSGNDNRDMGGVMHKDEEREHLPSKSFSLGPREPCEDAAEEESIPRAEHAVQVQEPGGVFWPGWSSGFIAELLLQLSLEMQRKF